MFVPAYSTIYGEPPNRFHFAADGSRVRAHSDVTGHALKNPSSRMEFEAAAATTRDAFAEGELMDRRSVAGKRAE